MSQRRTNGSANAMRAASSPAAASGGSANVKRHLGITSKRVRDGWIWTTEEIERTRLPKPLADSLYPLKDVAMHADFRGAEVRSGTPGSASP